MRIWHMIIANIKQRVWGISLYLYADERRMYLQIQRFIVNIFVTSEMY